MVSRKEVKSVNHLHINRYNHTKTGVFYTPVFFCIIKQFHILLIQIIFYFCTTQSKIYPPIQIHLNENEPHENKKRIIRMWRFSIHF